VIKYGLIDDPELFTWLEANMTALRAREAAALSQAIERSCRDKALVVAADEREAGRRALLNLGPTFGHALETGVGYGQWLHGEAVGTGLCMAADLSHRLGWITDTELARTLDLVRAAGLPVAPPPDIGADRFLELMAVDKKVLDGRLRLVLLKGIGKALVTDGFPLQALRETLDAA
jgi:3-dehydroquinate synthase